MVKRMSEEKAVEAINKMLNNFKTEKNQKKFKKWNKTMAWEFTDLEKTYHSVLTEGMPAAPIEGEPESADVRIIIDSPTWIGIMDGSISGMNAYTSKKLKIKGKMTDLMKLQKLM